MNLNFSIIENGKNVILSGFNRFNNDLKSFSPFSILYLLVFTPSAYVCVDFVRVRVPLSGVVLFVFLTMFELLSVFSLSIGWVFILSLKRNFDFFLSFDYVETFEFDVSLVFSRAFFSSILLWWSFIFYKERLSLKYWSFHSLKNFKIASNLTLFYLFGSRHFLIKASNFLSVKSITGLAASIFLRSSF